MRIDEGALTLQRLHGKTLRVPDLRPLYKNYRQAISPFYERLRSLFDALLESCLHDKKQIDKIKRTDFAKMAALCYPDAEWDRLQVIGQLLLWLFLWDDEIDRKIDPDHPSYASTWSMGNTYRKQSLQYVENELDAQTLQKTVAPTGACGIFERFAPALLHADAQVNIPQLMKDVRYFITCNGEEQKLRLCGILPTKDQYWTFRHGTGGMDCLSTVVQYVTDTNLPDEIAWSEEAFTMRQETSKNVLLMNDLLSLRKEIHDLTPMSMVPIVMHTEGKSLTKAVDYVMDELQMSSRSFDAAAEALRIKCEALFPDKLDEVNRFIGPFETFQSGFFEWSKGCLRYGIKFYIEEDGSFSIPL